MELYLLEKVVIIILIAIYAFKIYKLVSNERKQHCQINIKNEIFTLIILITIPSLYFFIRAFGWNSFVSKNMQDWGAYATCLATITSFISVILIYMTYKAQTVMYKEQTEMFKIQNRISFLSKFNEIFTNMLQIQRELYNKTNPDIFYDLHRHIDDQLEAIERNNKQNNSTTETEEQSFRSCVKRAYGTFFDRKNKLCSITLHIPDIEVKNKFTPKEFDNLRNYFKYLYYLVIYVVTNEELTENEKKVYMNMIQAQMSTDELFCYMVNVMDYYYRVDGRISNSIPDEQYSGDDNDQENNAYINILFKYNFFNDLFRKPNDVESNKQINEKFYEEFDFDFYTHQRNKENGRINYKMFPLDPLKTLN